MVKSSKFIILLFVAFLLCSCAFLTAQKDKFSQMTPKQKAVYFMDFYNAQYTDYKYVSSKEGLTEDEKIVLRKKKQVLIHLYASIKAYDAIVVQGKIPSLTDEEVVLKFINELLGVGKGG